MLSSGIKNLLVSDCPEMFLKIKLKLSISYKHEKMAEYLYLVPQIWPSPIKKFRARAIFNSVSKRDTAGSSVKYFQMDIWESS